MKLVETLENGRVRVRTVFSGPGRTQQQFKDECDVNKILKKFKRTGQLTHLMGKSGVYADVTELGSYLDMAAKVAYAEQSFAALPSGVRSRFANNPQLLINFLADRSNDAEAIKLGLRVKPVVDKPVDSVDKVETPK